MAKARRSGQIIAKGRGMWRVRWYLGEDVATGKRRYASETVRGTKRDAERRLSEVLGKADTGIRMTTGGVTLEVMLNEWLEDAAAQTHRHVRTRKTYRDSVRRYIVPSLGRVRVDRLDPGTVKTRLIHPLLEKGRKRTAEHARDILSAGLEWAAESKRYGIDSNPIRGRVRIKGKGAASERGKYARRALTRDQVANLRAAIESTRYELVFLTMLATGMRPSEVLGLRWEDIAFSSEDRQRWEGDEDPLAQRASHEEGPCLLVRRTLVAREVSDWSEGPVFGPPKTAAGIRILPLPTELVRRLREHRKEQSKWRLLGKLPLYAHDLVFVGRSGQPGNLISIRDKTFKPALKQAGLPRSVRLYDLRHTAITHAVMAATREGEAITSVSAWAGHASLKLTLDHYTHATEAGTRSVAQGVAARLLG